MTRFAAAAALALTLVNSASAEGWRDTIKEIRFGVIPVKTQTQTSDTMDGFIAYATEKLGVPVNAIEDVGFNGDAIEAEAFAYMAVRSVKGLPISFPTTTGVPHPMPGGKLNLPEAA